MSDQSQKQSGILLTRNSIFNLIGQVLPVLVGIATIPYILRGLGTNGFGILSIAWVLLTYFSMFDLGLSRATVKFTAEYLNPDKIHRLPGLIGTALTLQLLLGLAGALLAAALVPVSVDHFFKMPPMWVGQTRTSLFMLCSVIPILLCGNALRGVLEAAQRFDLINYVKVPASTSFYVLAVLAVAFHASVSGVVLLAVLCRAGSGVAYLILCLRLFPQLRKKLSFSREEVRPLVSFSRWVMVSNTAGPMFAYMERFIIATVLSVSMVSFYALPFELVSKILILPSSIVPALFPFFSYHGAGRRSIVSGASARAFKYLLFFMTPAAVVFVIFARPILQLWVGPDFAARSTVVLQLLAIAFFLNAFAQIPYTSVQALGRPDQKAILDAIALPTFVVCSWWLTRHWGINGAAAAKLLITIADCAFLFAFARRLNAFSLRDLVSGPLSRALLASGGLFIAGFVIHSFHLAPLLSVPLVLACLAGYAAIFWFAAVDADDRSTISGLLQQFMCAVMRRELDNPTC